MFQGTKEWYFVLFAACKNINFHYHLMLSPVFPAGMLAHTDRGDLRTHQSWFCLIIIHNDDKAMLSQWLAITA
jgi:hypothetical protein